MMLQFTMLKIAVLICWEFDEFDFQDLYLLWDDMEGIFPHQLKHL